jgi:hypothetical protein
MSLRGKTIDLRGVRYLVREVGLIAEGGAAFWALLEGSDGSLSTELIGTGARVVDGQGPGLTAAQEAEFGRPADRVLVLGDPPAWLAESRSSRNDATMAERLRAGAQVVADRLDLGLQWSEETKADGEVIYGWSVWPSSGSDAHPTAGSSIQGGDPDHSRRACARQALAWLRRREAENLIDANDATSVREDHDRRVAAMNAAPVALDPEARDAAVSYVTAVMKSAGVTGKPPSAAPLTLSPEMTAAAMGSKLVTDAPIVDVKSTPLNELAAAQGFSWSSPRHRMVQMVAEGHAIDAAAANQDEAIDPLTRQWDTGYAAGRKVAISELVADASELLGLPPDKDREWAAVRARFEMQERLTTRARARAADLDHKLNAAHERIAALEAKQDREERLLAEVAELRGRPVVADLRAGAAHAAFRASVARAVGITNDQGEPDGSGRSDEAIIGAIVIARRDARDLLVAQSGYRALRSRVALSAGLSADEQSEIRILATIKELLAAGARGVDVERKHTLLRHYLIDALGWSRLVEHKDPDLVEGVAELLRAVKEMRDQARAGAELHVRKELDRALEVIESNRRSFQTRIEEMEAKLAAAEAAHTEEIGRARADLAYAEGKLSTTEAGAKKLAHDLEMTRHSLDQAEEDGEAMSTGIAKREAAADRMTTKLVASGVPVAARTWVAIADSLDELAARCHAAELRAAKSHVASLVSELGLANEAYAKATNQVTAERAKAEAAIERAKDAETASAALEASLRTIDARLVQHGVPMAEGPMLEAVLGGIDTLAERAARTLPGTAREDWWRRELLQALGVEPMAVPTNAGLLALVACGAKALPMLAKLRGDILNVMGFSSLGKENVGMEGEEMDATIVREVGVRSARFVSVGWWRREVMTALGWQRRGDVSDTAIVDGVRAVAAAELAKGDDVRALGEMAERAAAATIDQRTALEAARSEIDAISKACSTVEGGSVLECVRALVKSRDVLSEAYQGWVGAAFPHGIKNSGAMAAALSKLTDLRSIVERLETSTVNVDIVFDGPPGPEAPRFVETETTDGKSVHAGEWLRRLDGRWVLRLRRPPARSDLIGRPTAEYINELQTVRDRLVHHGAVMPAGGTLVQQVLAGVADLGGYRVERDRHMRSSAEWQGEVGKLRPQLEALEAERNKAGAFCARLREVLGMSPSAPFEYIIAHAQSVAAEARMLAGLVHGFEGVKLEDRVRAAAEEARRLREDRVRIKAAHDDGVKRWRAANSPHLSLLPPTRAELVAWLLGQLDGALGTADVHRTALVRLRSGLVFSLGWVVGTFTDEQLLQGVVDRGQRNKTPMTYEQALMILRAEFARSRGKLSSDIDPPPYVLGAIVRASTWNGGAVYSNTDIEQAVVVSPAESVVIDHEAPSGLHPEVLDPGLANRRRFEQTVHHTVTLPPTATRPTEIRIEVGSGVVEVPAGPIVARARPEHCPSCGHETRPRAGGGVECANAECRWAEIASRPSEGG